MPQFNLYGVEEDCACLLNRVFSFEKTKLVAGVRYSKPVAVLFEAASPALHRRLKETRLLYVRGAFSTQPISFLSLDDGTYLVSEDQSGEMMTLALPGVEMSGGCRLLRPGSLSYSNNFWNKGCTTSAKASRELKTSFQSLVEEFKKCLVKQKICGSVWVGMHASNLLSKRKAKILSAGKWWTYQDGLARQDKRTGF